MSCTKETCVWQPWPQSPSDPVAAANSFSTSSAAITHTGHLEHGKPALHSVGKPHDEQVTGHSDFPQCQTHKSKGFRPRLLHECHFCTVVRGFYSRTHTSYGDKRETRIWLLFENHNSFLLHYLMSIHLSLGAVNHFLSRSSFISFMKLSMLFTAPRCKHDCAESHFEFRILSTEVWTVGFEK